MSTPSRLTGRTPAGRYKALREQLDQQLANIEAALDEHPPADTSQLHWGHVGDLGHYIQLLAEVEESLLGHPRPRKDES